MFTSWSPEPGQLVQRDDLCRRERVQDPELQACPGSQAWAQGHLKVLQGERERETEAGGPGTAGRPRWLQGEAGQELGPDSATGTRTGIECRPSGCSIP